MGWRDWRRTEPDQPTSGDFRTRLDQAGLSRWADQIAALDRHAIRLRSKAIEGDAPLGASRLGGEPDLPSSAAWPQWRDRPLSFIAQVALDEMPPVPDQQLPPHGLLSFFYESEQGVWGFDPADRGAWRVLWSEPGGDALERRAAPEGVPGEARYRACRLAGSVEVTHAGWESAELEALGMSKDELFAYAEVVDEDPVPIHRLLGHPEPVQGDMQLECQLVSNGLYCGDPSGYEDPRATELGPGAVNWRLLAQIDSDDEAGMMWGDLGRLYFWLTEDAMKRRDWASTWMIMQCT